MIWPHLLCQDLGMQANVDAAGITARTSGNARDPRGEWRPMNSLTLLLPKLG